MSKKYIYTKIVLLMLFVPAICGCGRAADPDVVLVSIGEDDITVSDFNGRVSKLPERYRDIVIKRKKEYLDELINDTLLYQEAIRKKIDKDKEVNEVINEAKKKILIARLLQDEMDKVEDVTDSDIAEFYEANKSKYMTPEIMRVSHILVPTREEAETLLGEIRSGADFEALARAKSVDPTAQRGGDIGYFPKGQLMPEFENACAPLKIGEVSDVVKTTLGYHIIKLTDRRPPQERPIEKVKENIRQVLRNIKKGQSFDILLTKLRDKTKVVVNEEALGNIGGENDKNENNPTREEK